MRHAMVVNMVKIALRICHVARPPSHCSRPAPFRRGAAVRQGRRTVSGSGAIVSDDLKLFATTFVAGFLFVSVLIG